MPNGRFTIGYWRIRNEILIHRRVIILFIAIHLLLLKFEKVLESNLM